MASRSLGREVVRSNIFVNWSAADRHRHDRALGEEQSTMAKSGSRAGSMHLGRPRGGAFVE